MNIVLVQVVYNEIDMLKWKYKWAKENGIKIFTFDNGSTDGSWQWLEKRAAMTGIHLGHEKLETFDIFSLKVNNRTIIKKFHDLKPDWCIVAGCDSFYKLLDYPVSLSRYIEIIDDMGFNAIDGSRVFNFYYTGTEDDKKDPRNEYHYYEERNNDWNIHLIAKFQSNFDIDGDQFKFEDKKVFRYENFVTLHYWFRSDARERFIRKWQRRNQSWKKGIDIKDHGKHYPEIVMQDKWVWSPVELQDIRRLKFEVHNPQEADKRWK